MKKNRLALLPFISALLLVGCGEDSPSEPSSVSNNVPADGSSVESIFDLGKCTSDRDGTVIFVEDEEIDYHCLDKKWEKVEKLSSSSDEKTSSSSKKSSDSKNSSSSSKEESAGSKDKSSSSKNSSSSSKITSSDSGDKKSSSSKAVSSDSRDKSSSSQKSSSSVTPESSSSVVGSGEDVKTIAINKKSFKGVAEKGPFAVGSTVKLSELDGELDLTGTNFEWEVTGKQGGYTSPKVTLSSQYAQLQVNGNYYNENLFKNSTSPVTLRGIVDLKDRESVNINVLMHLAYKRVVYLFTKSGEYKNVPAAKAAAEQEIMKAFGFGGANHPFEDLTIFGKTSDDAKLLAASILLQGDLEETDLLSRLTSIANNIEEDGTWDNSEKMRVSMADWIMSYSYGMVGIRQMLEEINPQVPAFEKYVSLFVGEAYGFGACTDENDGDYVQLKNGNSKNLGEYYVCEDNVWRLMFSTEKLYERACTAKRAGEFMTTPRNEIYICDGGNGYWRPATTYDHPKEYYMNDEVDYGKLKDTRDGKEYKTVVIGTQTWMAENLNYYDKDNYNLVGNAKCYQEEDKNCDVGGRLYSWTAAMNISTKYRLSWYDKDIQYPHQGICPDGWHIPDSTEWRTLADYVKKVDGSSGLLMSSKGWKASSYKPSTDPYGFSVIPVGAYYGRYADAHADFSQTEFDDDGLFANFWSAEEGKEFNLAVYVFFDYRRDYMSMTASVYNEKERGFSVRCVKTEDESEE